MDSNYSNYDMFDKLITNNKKAQSWTAFWAIALCILASIVIIMAIVNARQKRTIASLSLSADYKSRVIDSLKEIIQKEVDKKVESITNDITTLNTNIKKIEKEASTPGTNTSSEMATQKANFEVVNNSIKELNSKIQQIKTDIKKDRVRFFIQYNSKEYIDQVNTLSGYLKKNENYFVAPVELVDDKYPNLIKIYNCPKDEAEEIRLKEIISKIFNLSPKDIGVAHISSNPTVTKPTIEIWINGIKPSSAAK